MIVTIRQKQASVLVQRPFSVSDRLYVIWKRCSNHGEARNATVVTATAQRGSERKRISMPRGKL